MPFYLVTHTALAEADDEAAAARHVLGKLQVDSSVTFSVKLDEASIKHVSVNRYSEYQKEANSAPLTGIERLLKDEQEMLVRNTNGVDQSAMPSRRNVGASGISGATILTTLCIVTCCFIGLFSLALS